MRTGFLRSLLHPIGFVGSFLASTGLFSSLVLLVMDLLKEDTSPYRGIFAFMLFPGIMFLGFLFVGLGWFLDRRRTARLARASMPWRPALDIQKRSHRKILFALAGSMVLFLAASLVGAMRAYEFTESVRFCGETCHEPMGPQYTAYQDSPHARVLCAECHVGPGIEHYVEAKVSGLRQVYRVLTGTFSRPVHAARDAIIPASETCERCHWPEKFWGLQLDQRVRFGYDLSSSRRPIQIIMKIGGGSPGNGPQQGIHWHMNIKNKVRYRTLAPDHQTIPWVEVERPDGSTVVYRDPECRVQRGEVEQLPARRMDCLGCHNRPAHRFLTPDEAVDQALETGAVDGSLPFIKKAAVQALSKAYASAEAGAVGIRSEVEAFYRDKFEGKVLERRETLERTVAAVQGIFRRNVFPAMGVDGYTHPDNIGHREFPGCFRCHSGRHRSDDGRVLDSSCDLCHVFVEKARESASLSEVPADASSLHPWRGKDHQKVACWTCHTGSASPYAQCESCHKEALNGHGMQFECSICHKPGGAAVASGTCGPCHPAGGSPMHAHKDHGDCLACHRPHRWKVDLAASCAPCHKDPMPVQGFQGVLSHMKGLPASAAPARAPSASGK